MESLEAFKSFKNEAGTYDIDEKSLKEILSKFINKSKGKTKEKTKRPPSTYMMWLNENRQSIKEKYFDDYDGVETWEEDTVAQYYKDKGLGEPKKLKKPNMCILVSVKAGQLWKELSDDEKAKYKYPLADAESTAEHVDGNNVDQDVVQDVAPIKSVDETKVKAEPKKKVKKVFKKDKSVPKKKEKVEKANAVK